MAEGELIPIPQENAPTEPLGYWITVDFHPAIKLSRADGLKFAQSIADWVEPEDVQTEASEWRILGGSICEGIEIRISKRSLVVSVLSPSNSMEWYEHRFHEVLKSFSAMFAPKVALRSRVVVRSLLDLGGDADARSFLGGYVMLMDPSKLDPIGRPLHILGVRLFFPPYQDGPEDNADWGVDVRVESWGGDIRKLFLEADADWDSPSKWDDQFLDNLIQRISTVSKFISNNLIEFLRQPPWRNEEEGEQDYDTD